jgi:uncharacterized protein YhaN
VRINCLDISAFGPFTGMVLDFSATGTDLHVIYGPNEAGKSSALRALKAWLFGFPERTRDDFVHPRNALLVGGELSESGKALTFFRRKKRKGDVVDAEGNPMDPALLTPFLGGLDLSLFESLYGIDHDILVQGGREILARQGEIGEALFSAGAGLGSLHRVLEEMETEKDALYLKSGRKPRINQGIGLHKKLTKRIRELSLTPEQWQEHADRLDQVGRELEDVNSKRLQLDHRRQRLERLHRSVPLFARRKRVVEQQQALSVFRSLPPDFSKRRSEIQQELRSAGQRLDQAGVRKKLITGRLQKLSPHKSLIEKSARIEEGFQRLGEYSKAKKDRPRLEGMQAVLLKEADRLLRIIAPSLTVKQSEQLLPVVQQKKKIIELTSRHEALLRAQRDADTRLTTATQHLEKTEKILAELQEPEDWSQLKMTVSRGRRAGDIDKRIRELGRDRDTKQDAFALRLKQLGRWQGTDRELRDLELPIGQTIQLFQDELLKLEQETRLLNTQAHEIEDELLTVHTRQQELIYGGEIPSEDELQEVRKRRDQGWQLICRNWLDKEDISKEATLYAPDTELGEAVSGLILQADTISDRLRLEADRVHGFAALRSREEELKVRLQRNRDKQQEINTALNHHMEAWRILWQPLGSIPGTPKEMADWRIEMEQLQQQVMELAGVRKSITELDKERNKLLQGIRAELAGKEFFVAEGPELAPILTAAETLLDNLQREREHYQQTSRDLQSQAELVKQAERERERIEQDLEQWQVKWQQAARIPGTATSFEPDAAQDLLDTVERIFSTLKETNELESRLHGIDRDCLQFEEEIEDLSREVAADLMAQPVTRCVRQLHDRLTAARKEQTLHDNFKIESEELDKEIQESKLALKSGHKELDKLLVIAGCKAEDELVKAEQDAADHRRLAEQIEQIEQDLQQVAGEVSLEELSAQIDEIDSDSLPGELHALETEISGELDPAIQNLAEQKGEAKKVLEQMDGSELAAAKAEELENNLAALRTSADRFLRLQVGVDMLRREIENFRQKNQDPVLTIGSRLFAELTMGSFSGLKTDVDGRGEPVLVGIRADNQNTSLGVEAMSTGSRDQLYLALRLASLQHRAENGQSMPFIVDDILINFDDARSAATLQVLAELGKSNQLILFTHHRQVVEQAGTLAGVQIHELSK